MSVSDAASFAAAVAAIVALGISTWQSRIMVNQQRAAIRPFLRPGPAMMNDMPSFELPTGYMIRPLNVGFGPAFNVSACLYPPHPSAGETTDAKGIACYQHPAIDVFRGTVGEKGSTGQALLHLSEGIMLSGEHTIDRRGRFTLFAPPSQFTKGQYMKGLYVIPTRIPVLARLTLTYQDVEGRRYAAVFDYLDQHGWKQVQYLRNIPHTLDELNAIYTGKVLRAGESVLAIQSKLGRE